jgi:hypothetical protein
MKKQKEEKKPLYRVFNSKTDRPIYLAVGDGLEHVEAERLSNSLAVDTYTKMVYDPSLESEE